jgi:hypothetical protein
MSAELTAEQRVAVRVCDEWLKEVGLPLYSELAQEKIQAPAETSRPQTVGITELV